MELVDHVAAYLAGHWKRHDVTYWGRVRDVEFYREKYGESFSRKLAVKLGLEMPTTTRKNHGISKQSNSRRQLGQRP